MHTRFSRLAACSVAVTATVGLSACGSGASQGNPSVALSETSTSSTASPSSTAAPTQRPTTKPTPSSAPVVSASSAKPSTASSAKPTTVTATATSTAPQMAASTDAVRTMPGATRALRVACIDVNNSLADTNPVWNTAARTKTKDDLDKATNAMKGLAAQARSSADDSGNKTFAKKARNLADQATALSNRTDTHLSTADYNAASNDVIGYCAGMFPKA